MQTGGGPSTHDSRTISLPIDPASLPLLTGGVSKPHIPYIRSSDDIARGAIISINTFDIKAPPVRLDFGKINPRKLKNAGVVDLVDAFTDVFTPFKMECMIPVLLSNTDILPSCLNRDTILGPSAPLLQLTASGMKKGFIVACGGNHRLAAVTRIITDLEKQHKLLTKRRAMLLKEMEKESGKDKKGKAAAGAKTRAAAGKGRGKGGAKGKSKGKGKGKGKAVESEGEDTGIDSATEPGPDSDDDTNTSKAILAASSLQGVAVQLEDIENRKTYYSTWGVIVYDAGTSLSSQYNRK